MRRLLSGADAGFSAATGVYRGLDTSQSVRRFRRLMAPRNRKTEDGQDDSAEVRKNNLHFRGAPSENKPTTEGFLHTPLTDRTSVGTPFRRQPPITAHSASCSTLTFTPPFAIGPG